MPHSRWLLAAALAAACPVIGMADVVLSSNNGHTAMDAQKNQRAPDLVYPDTASIIDVKAYPPRIKGSFEAPGSVVGPPGTIWISADESCGIVTSATKADLAAKTGGISPDDRVAVFDLTSSPPK